MLNHLEQISLVLPNDVPFLILLRAVTQNLNDNYDRKPCYDWIHKILKSRLCDQVQGFSHFQCPLIPHLRCHPDSDHHKRCLECLKTEMKSKGISDDFERTQEKEPLLHLNVLWPFPLHLTIPDHDGFPHPVCKVSHTLVRCFRGSVLYRFISSVQVL